MPGDHRKPLFYLLLLQSCPNLNLQYFVPENVGASSAVVGFGLQASRAVENAHVPESEHRNVDESNSPGCDSALRDGSQSMLVDT